MTNIIVYSLIVILCLFFSSFLSAYETALTWINRHRLKSIAKQKSATGKRASKVFHLKNNFTSSLTVILVWNNIFNIVATTLLNLVFAEAFSGGDVATATTIAVVVSTILIIVFGEIIPKNLAFRYAEKFAIMTVYLLLVFKFISYPLVFLITKLMTKTSSTKINEKEILEVIDSSESEGLLEHHEKELIEAAINIKEKRVSFSMIPWTKVHSIRVRPSRTELLNIINDRYHYSRLPVLNQNKNKVIGFIKMKDVYRKMVLENIDPKNSTEKVDLEGLCFTPVFVSESDFLLDALEILQQKKLHIAVVVAEPIDQNDNKQHGTPIGIITLEDVLEELIGEIYDEHDEIKFNEPIVKVGLDKFHIRGDVSFNAVFTNYLTETHKPEGDYKTFKAWATTTSKQPARKGFDWEYENLHIKFHKKVGKSIIYEVTEKTISDDMETNPDYYES